MPTEMWFDNLEEFWKYWNHGIETLEVCFRIVLGIERRGKADDEAGDSVGKRADAPTTLAEDAVATEAEQLVAIERVQDLHHRDAVR